MGVTRSRQVYQRLDRCIPSATNMGYDGNWVRVDRGPHIFEDKRNREQFIYPSSPCSPPTTSRPSSSTTSSCCTRDGTITAKIEPDEGQDGVDQVQALKMLKHCVEVRLEEVLKAVPGSAGGAGAARMGGEAPPAYEGGSLPGAGKKR